MEFTLIDNCPVPAELADEIQKIKQMSGASLNSCDRSPEAEPLLARCGKHSQKQLYDMFVNHVAGANPANPPGRSTHERRNDGVAYPGTAGAQLEYWQVGMDWNNPPAAIAAARKLGWIATVTYPMSAHETQHVNFRKEPEEGIPNGKPGDDGPNVQKITHVLATIQSPINHQPYLPEAFPHYGDRVVAAVKRFQTEHHQDVDGIVGPHTATQLAVALRRHELQPTKE
ncbi:MAG: peptidoglycan-binding protein [Gaiellaceae bacterium]